MLYTGILLCISYNLHNFKMYYIRGGTGVLLHSAHFACIVYFEGAQRHVRN
jgi:hypothetical protein